MVIDPIVQTCVNFWQASYIVANGQAWKKSKAGKRCGKPLASSQLIGDLRDNVPTYRASDTSVQVQVLDVLLAAGTEDDTGEGSDAVIEEVDPWLVPLLMAFRWRSDGQTVRGFYHKHLAKALAKGGDGSGVVRELVPMVLADDTVLATALMGNPDVWEAYEEVYRLAVSDPAVRVTPKSVREGVRFYHSFRSYLKTMTPAWLSDMRFHIPEEPVSVANRAEVWAFWHFGPYTHELPDDPRPTPAWDGWLAKLGSNDRKRVFRAWVFGICLAKNKSRQMLWLEGRGGDGKGAVAGALARFLGERGVFALSDSLIASEFGAASMYGHRLLIHPDCKNPRLLSYALIHQVTGGDNVSINPKFGQPFTARMNARVMVLANCPPDMDIYNFHESSRMLYLLVNPDSEGADTSHLVRTADGSVQLRGDTGFEGRLLQEMPDFLAKCAVDYTELCPSHGNVVLPGSVVNDISDRCASTEQERFEKFYADNFEPDTGAWIETHVIREVFERIMPQGARSNIMYSAFVKYLESRGHRKIRPTGQDGQRIRGYIGIKPKGSEGTRIKDFCLHKNHVGIDTHEEREE